MSTQIAIEINDTAIIVHNGVELIESSPGYLISTSKQTWFGDEARDRAFLHSNQCENKFWFDIARAKNDAINQDSIELAILHLTSIWKKLSLNCSAVILIVPGVFTKTGLGLLLGMCRQLDIPVMAMVHQAVLCPYQDHHHGDTLHLDIQLHHSAITKLEKKGQEFSVGATKMLGEVGLISLYGAVAEYIAQQFIVKTRLDPIHSAELEQQLYNRLPQWLQTCQYNDVVSCQLQYKNKSFEVMIDAHELYAAYEPLVSNILHQIKLFCSTTQVIVCVSELFDKQFGITRFAHKNKLMVRTLVAGHGAIQSLKLEQDLISIDGQVYLNKQLPYTQLFDALDTPAENDEGYLKPDHILLGHKAYPINRTIYFTFSSEHGFKLVNKESVQSTDSLFAICDNSSEVIIKFDKQQTMLVNEREVQSFSKLWVGDCITLNSYEHKLQLIKVEN